MDVLSLMVFFIYALIILFILVYVSPLLSALVLILIPVMFVLLLPSMALDFLSTMQFSLVVPIYNIHILLLIWSAFIGIIAYTEVLSWYLLRETGAAKQKKPAASPDPSKPGEAPKLGRTTLRDFVIKIMKLLKGGKK